MKKFFYYSALILACAVSCDKVGQEGVTPEDPAENTPSAPVELRLSPQQKQVAAAISEGNVPFLGDLMDDYPGVDIVYSPYSLSLALSMLSLGAGGQTKEDILTFLGLKDFEEDDITGLYGALTGVIDKIDPDCTLTSSNSHWYAKDFPIKETFKQKSVRYFSAELFEGKDFSLDKTREEMNAWCAEKTKGLIQNMFETNPAEAIAILINALYFKGGWTDPMERDDTKRNFYHSNGTASEETEWITHTSSFPYFESESASVLSIPFGNGAFSFVIALPKEGVNIRDYVGGKAAEDCRASNSALKLVSLTVPVLEAEFKNDITLTLVKNGLLSLMLDADFSGMSDNALVVSKIVQASKLKIDEKGGEAAAVTVIEVEAADPGPDVTPISPIPFTADRPFLYGIRENESSMFLFLGVKQ